MTEPINITCRDSMLTTRDRTCNVTDVIYTSILFQSPAPTDSELLSYWSEIFTDERTNSAQPVSAS